jgi:hypothetical protein
MSGKTVVTLEDFRDAYRDSAPRNKREDKDNPFLQSAKVVHALAMQILDAKGRNGGAK